jgi:hypothetical protein
VLDRYFRERVVQSIAPERYSRHFWQTRHRFHQKLDIHPSCHHRFQADQIHLLSEGLEEVYTKPAISYAKNTGSYALGTAWRCGLHRLGSVLRPVRKQARVVQGFQSNPSVPTVLPILNREAEELCAGPFLPHDLSTILVAGQTSARSQPRSAF